MPLIVKKFRIRGNEADKDSLKCGNGRTKVDESRSSPGETEGYSARGTSMTSTAGFSPCSTPMPGCPTGVLAEAVGIAPSTCHGRVRRLQDIGVIRGFHADIDPAAIGLPLQAMISVSLQAGARGKIRTSSNRSADGPR